MVEVATGEHWLAKKAFELKLVDKLITSDEYINQIAQDHNVFIIEHHIKPTFMAKLMKPAANILNF